MACRIKGSRFSVIVENEEQVELSFVRMWDPSLEGKFVPLNIDKRFAIKFLIIVLVLVNYLLNHSIEFLF